jgi:hypothetical protein
LETGVSLSGISLAYQGETLDVIPSTSKSKLKENKQKEVVGKNQGIGKS